MRSPALSHRLLQQMCPLQTPMKYRRPSVVELIRIDGSIKSCGGAFHRDSIAFGADWRRSRLIIELDTPRPDDVRNASSGTFFAAPIPVIVYVAPDWCECGPAELFITEAGEPRC